MAVAVLLVRLLREFEVPATYFLPCVDPDWQLTCQRAAQYLMRPPQRDRRVGMTCLFCFVVAATSFCNKLA